MKHGSKLAICAMYITIGAFIVIISSTSGCGPTSRYEADESKAPIPDSNLKIRPLTDIRFEPTQARLERGKYLTEGILQCFICHSDRNWNSPGAPPITGKKGAGHVWEDRPWLVAPNISPDKETGAGNWTDDMFARAIREGISHDGRVLHPQMWYSSFRSLSDEDLASVIVYLRSIPPVYNPLPKTDIPDERRKSLMPPEPLTEQVPQPDMSDPVKRGNYLIRVADCIGCHTAWEAPLNPGFFGGGNLVEIGEEKVFSSNLTPDPSGISYYNDELFIQVMRSGQVKARKLSSIMPWIAFRNLDDEDLKSILAYLQARRPVRHTIDNTEPPTECLMCGQKHGFGDRNYPKIEQVVKVDSRVYDAYVGKYQFDDGFIIVILKEGDKLLAQFGDDETKIEIVPISENEFTAKEIPDVISFVKNERGDITHLISNGDDLAKRVR